MGIASRLGAVLSAFLWWIQPLGAQSPAITPTGDPSVRADTIYSLAVDPADYIEEDAVVLLDDGVIVLEHDGRASRTYRTVAQVLTRDAVEGLAELTFGYDGVREDFRLNWARVVGRDGRVISDEPAHQQVMDAPVPEQSPIFNDRKVVRVSLGGVEAGTIVDYSYTTVSKEAIRPGDFFSTWLITPGTTVRRSRLIADVPADFDLRTVSTPATSDPVVTSSAGRKVYTWIAADLERILPEHFADWATHEDVQRVYLGAPSSWSDVGAWYAGLAGGRYELTPEVLEAAERVVGDAEGVDALHALYRWIAQDIRYVSISLGIGGYQPRLPAEVLETNSGDCKDKATLFIALARHYGFEGHPVLLSSGGGITEELPSIQQFDHAIAAIRIDDEWVYLDLTAAIIPFGQISPGYQGEFGIIVFDDGSIEDVHFPIEAPEENLSHTVIEGELFEDGRFEGKYSVRHAGASQYQLRSLFAEEYTKRELDELAQRIAGMIEGGRGEGIQAFKGLDLEAEVSLGMQIISTRATRPNVGGGQIFFLPLPLYANTPLIAELEEELPTRRSPINAGVVVGPNSDVAELRLILPEGWRAKLPEDVVAESRFGSYEARYRQDGRTVSIVRRIAGRSGIEPKEALPELIAWLREVARDDVPFILLGPAS